MFRYLRIEMTHTTHFSDSWFHLDLSWVSLVGAMYTDKKDADAVVLYFHAPLCDDVTWSVVASCKYHGVIANFIFFPARDIIRFILLYWTRETLWNEKVSNATEMAWLIFINHSYNSP